MKMKKTGLWCYSFDGEDYSSGTFGSVEVALTEAKKAATEFDAVKLIYIAKADQQHNHSFFPDGSDIIEHMACQAYDVGGDYSNNYPDVPDEAETELTKALHKLLENWCKKYSVSPSFYLVSDPVVYDAVTLKLIKDTAVGT